MTAERPSFRGAHWREPGISENRRTGAGYRIRVEGGSAYLSGMHVPHFWTVVCLQSYPRAACRFAFIAWRPALRLHQRRIPAPEIVVGQVRASPPAIDRIVAAEIFLVGEDGLAEIG